MIKTSIIIPMFCVNNVKFSLTKRVPPININFVRLKFF